MSATNHAVAKLAVPARSPFTFLETFIFGIAHMSLWQKGRLVPKLYAEANGCMNLMEYNKYGMVQQLYKTGPQAKQARFALHESTRLYGS